MSEISLPNSSLEIQSKDSSDDLTESEFGGETFTNLPPELLAMMQNIKSESDKENVSQMTQVMNVLSQAQTESKVGPTNNMSADFLQQKNYKESGFQKFLTKIRSFFSKLIFGK